MKLQLYIVSCKVVVSYIPIQFKKLFYFIWTLASMIISKSYRQEGSKTYLDPL